MDILNRLIGGEFYALYFGTAATLAQRLDMGWYVDDDLLASYYEGWAAELSQAVQNQEVDPEHELFWTYVLSSIAVPLCTANCVYYEARSLILTDLGQAGHQTLLRHYAREYTALELVRELHMDVYLSLKRVQNLGNRPALPNYAVPHLAGVFSQIRANPLHAANYHELLHLPVY